jgi:hypothetical protein
MGMILAALGGLSLVVVASFEPLPSGIPTLPPTQMSIQQKSAAIRPLVRSATECVARTVSGDPRFPTLQKPGDVNELIVDSMGACTAAMRAMIDAYDRYYGEGSGETFFMGPYLDFLPVAVNGIIKGDEQ